MSIKKHKLILLLLFKHEPTPQEEKKSNMDKFLKAVAPKSLGLGFMWGYYIPIPLSYYTLARSGYLGKFVEQIEILENEGTLNTRATANGFNTSIGWDYLKDTLNIRITPNVFYTSVAHEYLIWRPDLDQEEPIRSYKWTSRYARPYSLVVDGEVLWGRDSDKPHSLISDGKVDL